MDEHFDPSRLCQVKNVYKWSPHIYSRKYETIYEVQHLVVGYTKENIKIRINPTYYPIKFKHNTIGIIISPLIRWSGPAVPHTRARDIHAVKEREREKRRFLLFSVVIRLLYTVARVLLHRMYFQTKTINHLRVVTHGRTYKLLFGCFW